MRGGFVRLTLGVVALLTLFSSLARAEVPRLVLYHTFPTMGGLGVAVDNSCVSHSPPLAGSACTAFDPSAGDVFTTGFVEFDDEGNLLGFGHSQKFNPAGKPLTPPSPFGNGGDYGAAVNPVTLDLYVAHGGFATSENEIEVYDPNTGTLVPSIPPFHPAEFGETGNAVGIASDSAGDVYVPSEPNHEVLEYDPAACTEQQQKGEPPPCKPLQTFTGAGTLSGPRGVALDSSGDLWVADSTANRIEELSPADVVMKVIGSEGVQALALDAHGDVFVSVRNGADFCGAQPSPCSHLVEYGPSGAQLADIGAGDFGVVTASIPSMVSVNESSGLVYVTDMGKNLVWVFGPTSAPMVTSELTAEVGASQAKLGALVSLGGINTTYRFEYGPTASYGQATPVPEGSAGEGVSARTVWATAKGLSPGTTYHFRVVVSNALGREEGRDQTFTTATAAETSCPSNEQLRAGFSASLPDCRAYELVTPSNTASAQPDPDFLRETPRSEGGGFPLNQAARDGSRMSFQTEEVLPGASSAGLAFVSTRGVAGWSTEDVLPLQSYTGDRCLGVHEVVEAFAADVSRTVLRHPFGTAGGCGVELVEVVAGEPRGVENLLLRDNATGSYRLIDVTPPGVTPEQPRFLGASADLGHVVFAERAPLVLGAPAGVEDVYEWSGGTLRLVTVLEDGTPVSAEFAGISADGSVVLFTANGNLYARLDGQRTVQVDATQGPGTSGGGADPRVTADGSIVFFTDDSQLTEHSTAQAGEPDLYRCRIVEAAGHPRCDLEDLTVAKNGEHADAGLDVLSEDGSYVYFAAKGVLADNAREHEGVGGEPMVETAVAGEPNLYVEHEGATSFIATGVGGTQASLDGEYLAITSTKALTGYQNTDTQTGKPDPEIFIYNVSTGGLSCVSCKPSGEAPSAGGAFAPRGVPTANLGAIKYLSDGGRLFFQTAEALLPADTNGKIDVYEYGAGALHLISTGTSSSDSYLLEASEGGKDVFLLTRQKLLARDTNEEALSIYDARVDGGFLEPVSPSACTNPEACRGVSAPQPSIFGAPASQTFSGAGNLKPTGSPVKKHCKKGFVDKKGKCVKKQKPKKRARKPTHVKRRGR